MKLHGQNLIGGTTSVDGTQIFKSIDPTSGVEMEPAFFEASNEEIDRAMTLAAEAFPPFRATSAETRASFLELIAEEVDSLGDQLLETAHSETGLPLARCTGERGRATSQARLFAELLREGSWADARIDLPDPDRAPLPKPDVRSLLRPIGPVVVFGASNFPIAISVFGADTVSALAAGCPVVVKAHPAHPATCELVARALLSAADRCGLPEGVFSMVHGRSNDVGLALVNHPKTCAVAFTGSLAGGRALFDAAAARPHPIPFYGEMGSINPIFLLPGALKANAKGIAEGFVQSLNLGVGQFCTNPGLVLGIDGSDLSEFIDTAGSGASAAPPATMLHSGIHAAFLEGTKSMQAMEGIELVARSEKPPSTSRAEAACHLFESDYASLMLHPELMEEVFGPVSTVVRCENPADLATFASSLDGSLTASIHGTPEDLSTYSGLVDVLESKVGRLIFNGFPTGIEVCASMHHGGPYPATTHSFFTSIGTRCIYRFTRPVCYQDWPDGALPAELRNTNSLGISRLVDNRLTRDDC